MQLLHWAFVAALAVLAPATLGGAEACSVETIAGGFAGPAPGDGGPAIDAELASPVDARFGPDGALYISDSWHRAIRRVDPDGTIATFAGTGARGFAGDGGPATAALLDEPGKMAFGPDGSLYFIDVTRVRRVDPAGDISTVAGNGGFGIGGLNGPAVQASIGGIDNLTVGPAGSLFLVSTSLHAVFVVRPDGVFAHFAGAGRAQNRRPGFGGDGGPAVEALLNTPGDIVVDSLGVVYILDRGNARIRTVDGDGLIQTYVGNGRNGPSPDGAPASEIELEFRTWNLEIDGLDRLYWATTFRVWRLARGGVLETAAVNLSGTSPRSVAVDSEGQVTVSLNQQAANWLPDGEMRAVAGVGPTALRGDGGPAKDSVLGRIVGMGVGPSGSVYLADQGFARIRAIRPDGTIERVAGTGEPTYVREPAGLARQTPIYFMQGLAVDAQERVLFTEGAPRVMRVETDGTIAWIAGDGISSTRCPWRDPDCGDGGPAIDAAIPSADSLAVDSAGTIYVRHSFPSGGAGWIRRIAPDGTISTLSTRDLPAQSRPEATAMAVTADNRLVLSIPRPGFTFDLASFGPDGAIERIREYDRPLEYISALVSTPGGELIVADQSRESLNRLTVEGVIQRLSGGDFGGFGGGSGDLLNLQTRDITAMAMTPNGGLLLNDSGNRRVLLVHDIAACQEDPRPQLAPGGGVVHGASFRYGLSPGAVFTLLGSKLGPSELTVAQVDSGSYPLEIAGVRVTFDGIPASLLYVSDKQVAGIVPWNTPLSRFSTSFLEPGFSPVIVIESGGLVSHDIVVDMSEAAPGVFTLDSSGSGQAAALNQDGSVNGPANPARPGSVVVLYGTGLGPLEGPVEDGAVTTGLSRATLPVSAQVAGSEAEVLYAGSAPGMVSGIVQVNVKTPDDAPENPSTVLTLRVGESDAPNVTIAVGR